MSLVEGVNEVNPHVSSEPAPALDRSSFLDREPTSSGKILSATLDKSAQLELKIAAGTRVVVELATDAGAISLARHPNNKVLPYDRRRKMCHESAELILSAEATIKEGKLVDPVLAKFADERGDSLIQYNEGSPAIVNNKLGMELEIQSGSPVEVAPASIMFEAA